VIDVFLVVSPQKRLRGTRSVALGIAGGGVVDFEGNSSITCRWMEGWVEGSAVLSTLARGVFDIFLSLIYF
jgi:hypothetical protein